jgi:prevent-host-death family protein
MSFIMDSVGAYEAKTQLSKLLDRVMKGERITITKHGVPVAVLQPPDSRKSADLESVISEILRFREKHSLKGQPIKDLIEEGRR